MDSTARLCVTAAGLCTKKSGTILKVKVILMFLYVNQHFIAYKPSTIATQKATAKYTSSRTNTELKGEAKISILTYSHSLVITFCHSVYEIF